MSENSLFGGLKEQLGDYASTLGRKALSSAGGQVDKIADKLDGGGGSSSEAAKAGAEEIAEGKSPAKAALSAATTGAKDKIKGAFGADNSGSGGGSGDFKFSNIVETADVGVPLSVAYNAFTMFEDWPDFMKKVENVERTDDVKLSVKGQAVWSHRTWEATITEQVPDSHIVWESTGDKGYISGSVSFHELAPRLTRIIAVGEYHKQGFVEGIHSILPWRTGPQSFAAMLEPCALPRLVVRFSSEDLPGGGAPAGLDGDEREEFSTVQPFKLSGFARLTGGGDIVDHDGDEPHARDE